MNTLQMEVRQEVREIFDAGFSPQSYAALKEAIGVASANTFKTLKMYKIKLQKLLLKLRNKISQAHPKVQSKVKGHITNMEIKHKEIGALLDNAKYYHAEQKKTLIEIMKHEHKYGLNSQDPKITALRRNLKAINKDIKVIHKRMHEPYDKAMKSAQKAGQILKGKK